MLNLKKILEDPDLELAYSCKASAPLSEISSSKEYQAHLESLESFYEAKDQVTSKQAKKIISDTIKHTANLVEAYEKNLYTSGKKDSATILASFMADFGLKQNDLAADFGSQSIVSEVLNGKRKITIEAAKKLAKRFSVSPTLFLDI
ncbi:MAG: helix-turn-helix domain-containing protein [Bdellovibrionaceae bacterium]|nr:helix-turn-helix domain-containing protein [Bdellovibrionales bacterium]MCB9083787.1 helix-turn-helix domain-containing protein [Pseudobdellovibrionaceae bacterium]